MPGGPRLEGHDGRGRCVWPPPVMLELVERCPVRNNTSQSVLEQTRAADAAPSLVARCICSMNWLKVAKGVNGVFVHEH